MSVQPKIRTILYATDLGKHTRPVFRQAVALARQCQARIVMLHVVEPLGATGQAVLSLYLPKQKVDDIEKQSMKQLIEQMKARLTRLCQEEGEACADGSALVKDLVVATGRASDMIPQQARLCGADLIIIGSCSYGHGGLLGSTARRVTQESPIPVMVVPNC